MQRRLYRRNIHVSGDSEENRLGGRETKEGCRGKESDGAAEKKLEVQGIIERQRSRGEILEKYLREPLLLTNEEIDSLLELMFRSSFSQQQLDKLIAPKKPPMAKAVEAEAKAVEEKKSVIM